MLNLFGEEMQDNINEIPEDAEYNKIKHAAGNEAKAVLYFQRRVAAFDRLRENMDLTKVSAKEFLDAPEKLASQENGEAYQKVLDEILSA